MDDISGESASVSLAGFLSGSSDPDEGWPTCYVIVATDPEHWMATLPLEELMEIVDSDASPPLRDIPWRWDEQELVVSLGPVRLRGARDEWRSLARRLIDSAGSASELYEAPGTFPWHGPYSELRVTALVPIDRGVRGDWVKVGPSAPLAAAGGFSDEEFQEVFGLGWRREGEEVSLFEDDLYLWGSPPQLAAVISPDGLSIGTPGGQWIGAVGVRYEANDLVPVNSDMPRPMITAFVKERLRQRRRSFTWCRHCGDQLVPEARYDRDTCYGCASVVHGIVY